MLVLSRKQNEGLVIGDGIIVNVVEIRGDKVRLAIEAAPQVPVHRGEVLEAFRRIESASSQQTERMNRIHG